VDFYAALRVFVVRVVANAQDGGVDFALVGGGNGPRGGLRGRGSGGGFEVGYGVVGGFGGEGGIWDALAGIRSEYFGRIAGTEMSNRKIGVVGCGYYVPSVADGIEEDVVRLGIVLWSSEA